MVESKSLCVNDHLVWSQSVGLNQVKRSIYVISLRWLTTLNSINTDKEGIDAIQRRLRGKMSNSRATHPTPTANDVQLGRGGHNWAWAGNEQLRQFALGRVQDYATATKKQKALISW